MSEYIGARISLISKSDIRYVGTLHEINSENSTVALENVSSFGTEGRRNGEGEIPPSESVYEYIVFRGSDVKDLRIEEKVEAPKPAPPPMPNDPAILGAARPPSQAPAAQPGPQAQPPNLPPHSQPPYPTFGPGPYPPFNNQRFGPPGGFPGGPGGPGGFPGGYPGMPYGAPPGWGYPPGPPGQGGFPPGPGPFPPHPVQMPIGPPTPGQQPPGSRAGQPGPIGSAHDEKPTALEADAAPKLAEPQPKSQTTTPAPAAPTAQAQAPPPPVESKPEPSAAMAPPQHPTAPRQAQAPKGAPAGPKGTASGRIVPAVPLPRTNAQSAAQAQTAAGQAAANPTAQYQNATQAATAAVAQAMAKIAKQAQPQAQDGEAAIQNLTQKVADMRTDDKIRHGRQPGTGGYATRSARGPRRGSAQATKPMELPTEDYDFESANAKFNKQDLVKEAIASGSPMGTPNEGITSPINGASTNPNGTNGSNGITEPAPEKVVIPAPASYNKSSSFFDNISSEIKDREESGRLGGQEFRTEERKKNLETFGQGSVDNYRGGYRGRGRGRGFGRGGRGFGGRGRGAPRRGGPAHAAEMPAV